MPSLVRWLALMRPCNVYGNGWPVIASEAELLDVFRLGVLAGDAEAVGVVGDRPAENLTGPR
jgi:hypothetical protein